MHERRTGTRAANGTAFGFNNVIETPEPLKYITQDFGVNATFRGDWGNAFAGFNLNDFENKYDTFGWDNPFRGHGLDVGQCLPRPLLHDGGPVDGPDGPGPEQRGLDHQGRHDPEVRPGDPPHAPTPRSASGRRTSSSSSAGRPTPRSKPRARVPANNLDGKIDVLALNGYFTTKFTDALRFNARYRLYENENKTPRISFDGYVRFDAVWEDIPRINVPYGFKSNLLRRLPDLRPRSDGRPRGGLEVQQDPSVTTGRASTPPRTCSASPPTSASASASCAGIYEFGDRELRRVPAGRGRRALLPGAGPAGEQHRAPSLRPERSATATASALQVQVSPGSGVVTLSASYFYNKDEYDNGLVSCNADYHDGDVGDSARTCAGGQTETLGPGGGQVHDLQPGRRLHPERATSP